MANQGYSTRPLVPITVPSSQENSLVTEVLQMDQRYTNPCLSASPQDYHQKPSNFCWQDPQNFVPPGILPTDITAFGRSKDIMNLETLGRIPVTEEPNLKYRHNSENEEVVKYPRMDHSPVSRPAYSQLSLDPHSPQPRIASGTQSMFQNIIGYTEPAFSSGPSRNPNNQKGFSGDTGRHQQTMIQHSGQTQRVCGYCKDPLCKYADTYICAMAATQARSAQGRELYDSFDGMWRDMRAQGNSNSSK